MPSDRQPPLSITHVDSDVDPPFKSASVHVAHMQSCPFKTSIVSMQPKKQEQDQTQRGNYFSPLMASDMMSYQHAMQLFQSLQRFFFFLLLMKFKDVPHEWASQRTCHSPHKLHFKASDSDVIKQKRGL